MSHAIAIYEVMHTYTNGNVCGNGRFDTRGDLMGLLLAHPPLLIQFFLQPLLDGTFFWGGGGFWAREGHMVYMYLLTNSGLSILQKRTKLWSRDQVIRTKYECCRAFLLLVDSS